MKKIFTLIAATLMAVGANAQLITWSEAVAAADLAPNASWSNGEFTATITDNGNKMKIDANSQYFGTADEYVNLTYRLSTGGKTGTSGGVLTNYITLNVPSAGTLKIYVRTGSASATDRNLQVKQGTSTLLDKIIKEDAATDYATTTIDEKETKVFPIISVNVAKGDVSLEYPVNGLAFYGFGFISSTTGITNVKVVEPAVANDAIYNLSGQKVNKNYKGVVIKNGVKTIQK